MTECYTDIYVARYEVYPNVDPTGYCVGYAPSVALTTYQDIGILSYQTQISLAGVQILKSVTSHGTVTETP